MNTLNTQMELSFNNAAQANRPAYHQTRMEQAQWWFARIRQMLDAVETTQPAPTARPVQEHFKIAA